MPRSASRYAQIHAAVHRLNAREQRAAAIRQRAAERAAAVAKPPPALVYEVLCVIDARAALGLETDAAAARAMLPGRHGANLDAALRLALNQGDRP